MPLLPFERNCGGQCWKRLQVMRWAGQRGLLLAITRGGGQHQEPRNKLWGTSFNTHLGLTELCDGLLSSQMALGFGEWMGPNQNASCLRLHQNVVYVMVGLWWDMWIATVKRNVRLPWLSFTIIDTGSTKVTGDFMETVSFLPSGSRSTCFLRGRLEVNRWWVGVCSSAGAGTPCVKDHSNLLFYTMWKNNEGHAEGSGKAISTVSDLWPIQCSICAVIGGIISPTEALRSLLS